MDPSPKLKSFVCPIHPDEIITRVSLDSASPKTLFCLECIIELEKSEKNNLIDCKNFVQSLFKDLSQLSSCVINSNAPFTLSSLLENKDAYESKFSEHILNQKMKVCTNIKAFQDDFNKKIEETRDKILLELDTQLEIFKKNFKTFEEQVKKTFRTSDERDSMPLSEETLIDEFNGSRSTIDFSSKIKSYLFDIDEHKEFKDVDKDERELLLLKSLKLQVAKIEKHVQEPVTSYAASDLINSESREDLEHHLKIHLNEITTFKNKIFFIKQDSFSDLITPADVPFIKDIINRENIKFNLLNSTSYLVKGTNLKELFEIWTTKPSLLCLVKKLEGNVVGVYKEKPGYGHEVTSFDVTKKKLHQGIINQPNNKEYKRFKLSELIVLGVPPYTCFSGLTGENPETATLEELQELMNDGFVLEAAQVFEVDYLGREKLDEVPISSTQIDSQNTSQLGKKVGIIAAKRTGKIRGTGTGTGSGTGTGTSTGTGTGTGTRTSTGTSTENGKRIGTGTGTSQSNDVPNNFSLQKSDNLSSMKPGAKNKFLSDDKPTAYGLFGTSKQNSTVEDEIDFSANSKPLSKPTSSQHLSNNYENKGDVLFGKPTKQKAIFSHQDEIEKFSNSSDSLNETKGTGLISKPTSNSEQAKSSGLSSNGLFGQIQTKISSEKTGIKQGLFESETQNKSASSTQNTGTGGLFKN